MRLSSPNGGVSSNPQKLAVSVRYIQRPFQTASRSVELKEATPRTTELRKYRYTLPHTSQQEISGDPLKCPPAKPLVSPKQSIRARPASRQNSA